MKIRSMIFLLLSTISLFSCETESAIPADGITLTSGQSFGFCIGPCYQTFTINSENTDVLFYVKSTEFKGNQGVAKELNYTDRLSDQEWNEIMNLVPDFNEFKQLNEVYGCPDCADGGAEFIEISKDGISHKVTFEYSKSVKELDKLIPLLRQKRQELSAKYVQI